MVKIIEHNDYNKPIDNKTVAWLNYIGIDNKQYIVKGFKYTENIWVIPEVIALDKESIQQGEKFWNAYDYTYLNTKEEKTNYLKDMSILLKRISSIKLGQSFLQELDSLLLSKQEAEIYMLKDPNKKVDKNNIIKEIKSAIFIQGNYHLNNSYNALSIYNSQYASISFTPNIALGFHHHKKEGYYTQDPVIALLNQLIHLFHKFHKVKYNINIKDTRCTLGEIVMLGASELPLAQKEIESLSKQLLEDRKKIISTCKKDAPKEEIKYYINQYNLTYDKKPNLSTNQDLDQQYLERILKHFTETNFSKELEIPHRLFYMQYQLPIPFIINLQDKKIYSTSLGLIKNIITYNEQPIYTIHPNTNIPVGSLLLKKHQYLNANHWDCNASASLKKIIQQFESTAVLSKVTIPEATKDKRRVLPTPMLDSSKKAIQYAIEIPKKALNTIIITHHDYNAPIDNETVAWLDYIGFNGDIYVVKAFKYTEGIWVIPEVVGIDKEKMQKTQLAETAYNYDYLATVEEKTNYLKDMNILFTRMSKIRLGRELIENLSYTNPVSEEDMSYIIKDYDPNKNKNPDKYYKTAIEGAIFIHGSYDLTNTQVLSLVPYSFISFCPNILQPWFHHSGDSSFFQDPAIVLLHELTHVFHNTVYVPKDDKDHKKIDQVHAPLLESLVIGGNELTLINTELNEFKEKVLKKRSQVIKQINSFKDKSPEFLEYFIKRYHTQYDQKKKQLLITEESNQEYLDKLFYYFTEIKFSQAFGLPYRLFYAQTSVTFNFKINLQDPKMYSINKGLTQNLVSYKEAPIYTVHPNAILPRNRNFSVLSKINAYDWDARANKNLKKVLKQFEPKAVLSNTFVPLATKECPNPAIPLKKDSSGNPITYFANIPEELVLKHKPKRRNSI